MKRVKFFQKENNLKSLGKKLKEKSRKNERNSCFPRFFQFYTFSASPGLNALPLSFWDWFTGLRVPNPNSVQPKDGQVCVIRAKIKNPLPIIHTTPNQITVLSQILLFSTGGRGRKLKSYRELYACTEIHNISKSICGF